MVKLRTLEIACMGAFQLCEQCEDLADYFGEIQSLDAALGVLLAKLEAVGELEARAVAPGGRVLAPRDLLLDRELARGAAADQDRAHTEVAFQRVDHLRVALGRPLLPRLAGADDEGDARPADVAARRYPV